MFARSKVAALVAEFVGVAVLSTAVLAFTLRTTLPFFAALTAGLVVGVMMMAMGSVSGAHLNPVVTIGLWTMRKIETAQAAVYVAAQMLGGVAAWQLNEFLITRPLRNIAGESFEWRVLISEAIGAFVFTVILSAAITRAYEGARLAFVTGAGLALGMISSSLASNGIINPALAIGLQSWSLAYAVGPLAGALIGMHFYKLLFLPIDVPGAKSARVTRKVAKVTKKVTKKAKKKTAAKKR